MYTFLTFPRILAGVVGLWIATLAVPLSAQAGGVHVSIGVGIPLPVIVAPPPAVIVEPYPVIVQPAPVVVAPAYVVPRPYYARGHYGHWKRHHNESRAYYRGHHRGHHRHHHRHHDHD